MRLSLAVIPIALSLGAPDRARASGELVPTTPGRQALKITDHEVKVVILNGFARTEVVQTFDNPNASATEAVYRFPIPRSASLSEIVVRVGESVVRGEVVAAREARSAYEAARASGQDAALAEKDGHTDLRFAVAQIPAHEDAVVRFVYYQPLTIDAGIGRWIYPLESGGRGEGASFWTHTEPAGDLTVDLELKTAWPVDEIRMPGWQPSATIDRLGAGHLEVHATLPDDSMDRDLVFYYRLADDLPGRVEILPYRGTEAGPGTFMVVVTPGAELAPLDEGVDTVFLLDVSGSMSHTLKTLSEAVQRSLGELRPGDRFRIVTFSTQARELVPWTSATPEGIASANRKIQSMSAKGGTNLHHGLTEALSDLAGDRVAQVVLVTDAVANEGEVRPQAFAELLTQHDVRLFCFMLGNGGNWPLMNVMTDASGGFAAGVSNEDDILGQILLAKSKLSHAALHDVRLSVRGAGVHDVTDEHLGKVFRGEQLVAFGRYDRPGPVEVAVDARVGGVPRSWTTTATLPAIAADDPELERLWALRSVEVAELERDRGERTAPEAAARIRQLGIDYQLVTDETSMVALTDAQFEARGIERRNLARATTEHAAQDRRAGQPAPDRVVDQSAPAFPARAPSLGGGGGGALDPLSGGFALALSGLALWRRHRTRR